MIDFDEAITRLLRLTNPLEREDVKLAKAHRRVLAKPVEAAVHAPPADVSSMDGYAVRDADLSILPATLRIVRENFAGSAEAGAIVAGECARIFTGAPLPAGANRVVMQEKVARNDDLAIFTGSLDEARFVRAKGSDFSVSDQLLAAGTVLGPRQLVAAAAADLGLLTCWRKPRVRVLATGDELAEPGTARNHRGAVPESLSVALAAFISEWGGETTGIELLGDDVARLELSAAKACQESDLVLVTGGASVGEKDFSKAMFAPLGLGLTFEKVAIKPGKPVWLGRVDDAVVLGLPGNPTSAMATARLFLAPLLAGMAGQDAHKTIAWRSATLAQALPACGSRETFSRGSLQANGSITPITNQDSGSQAALAKADVLIRQRADSAALKAGETAQILDF